MIESSIFVLFFIMSLSIFATYEIHGGKSPAPLVRLFYFKSDQLNNCQDAAFREGAGVSVILIHILALFVCINFTEFNMLHSKSSRAKLERKLSILSVAVTTAVSKIKEVEGLQSLNATGVQIAFDEFTTELNQFIENHSLYPANEEKIRSASRKLNYQFNWMLNGVIENINILPKEERIN